MYRLSNKKYSYSAQVASAKPWDFLGAPLQIPTDVTLLKAAELSLFSMSVVLLLSGSFIGGGKLHSIITQPDSQIAEQTEATALLSRDEQSLSPDQNPSQATPAATSSDDEDDTEEEAAPITEVPDALINESESNPEPIPRLIEGPKPSSNTPALVSWTSNRLSGKTVFKGPHNPAQTTADAWRSTKPASAAQLDKVAAPAKGIWLTMGLSNIKTYIGGINSSAANAGQLPTYVLYGMPTVGCGAYTSAPFTSYLSWVKTVDAAITTESIIVIEPDEIPLDQCGGSAETNREKLLLEAVKILAGNNRHLYIDAGHSNWVGVTETAARLNRVGIKYTNGFSLNVSNYETTANNRVYGNQLSAALGGAHYIIDTSRNGLGPNATNEWCNASGRALGEAPVVKTSSSKLDALLWVKYPGESDGTCNSGPNEGAWWPEYAEGLAQRSAY